MLGYNLKPSMIEINRMTLEELQNVENFTVYN